MINMLMCDPSAADLATRLTWLISAVINEMWARRSLYPPPPGSVGLHVSGARLLSAPCSLHDSRRVLLWQLMTHIRLQKKQNKWKQFHLFSSLFFFHTEFKSQYLYVEAKSEMTSRHRKSPCLSNVMKETLGGPWLFPCQTKMEAFQWHQHRAAGPLWESLLCPDVSDYLTQKTLSVIQAFMFCLVHWAVKCCRYLLRFHGAQHFNVSIYPTLLVNWKEWNLDHLTKTHLEPQSQ